MFEKLKKWWRGEDSARASPEDKKALASFVQNVYWGEDLSPEEAKRNVAAGLLEILWTEGGHRANGLLITANGYFITNYHCVEGDPENCVLQDFLGVRHRIQRICCISKSRDLVLAKAGFSGEPLPLRYKYFHEENFGQGATPVVALTWRNGEIVMRGGYTHGKTEVCETNIARLLQQQIRLEISVQTGDSGGVVASMEGRLIGLLSGKYRDGVPIAYCARWFDVLDLITMYCVRK